MKRVTGYWPPVRNFSTTLKPFQQVSEKLSIENGMLLRGDLFIPPKKLRKRFNCLAHRGHPCSTAPKKL